MEQDQTTRFLFIIACLTFLILASIFTAAWFCRLWVGTKRKLKIKEFQFGLATHLSDSVANLTAMHGPMPVSDLIALYREVELVPGVNETIFKHTDCKDRFAGIIASEIAENWKDYNVTMFLQRIKEIGETGHFGPSGYKFPNLKYMILGKIISLISVRVVYNSILEASKKEKSTEIVFTLSSMRNSAEQFSGKMNDSIGIFRAGVIGQLGRILEKIDESGDAKKVIDEWIAEYDKTGILPKLTQNASAVA